MIAPKKTKPTPKEESLAYELCTIRDDNRCQRCLRDCGAIHRDHRRNRSQQGWTVASNLQCLGSGCHKWCTEHPKQAVADGWAVPGWADWERWPARRYEPTRTGKMRAVWVLYDNDGDYRIISDERAESLMTGTSRWLE